jgi:hypothetical protein
MADGGDRDHHHSGRLRRHPPPKELRIPFPLFKQKEQTNRSDDLDNPALPHKRDAGSNQSEPGGNNVE